ncbi:MAG: HTH-type transcriptional repressor YtrA [Candidatus Erwinia impunctatus]|nr:HTH-type transcriptional repressor YtrA [Culicoides impunctatus]
MRISIDKSLPIALHTQIVGTIEYGIMAGSFRHQTALPSVRALSRELEVAQLTVSHAYQALKAMGLIETIPGKGTYIVREKQEQVQDEQVAHLQQRFQHLLQEAASVGLSPSFFVGVINQENQSAQERLPFTVAIVGNSNRINRSYLAVMSEILGFTLVADTYTFREFDALHPDQIKKYGFFLTVPHCIPRLRQRVAEQIPVYAPYLIPAESSRMQLAALAADTPVLLVSRYPTFMPAMVEGVRSFAPHLGKISTTMLHDEGLLQKMSHFRVVIYSTGCHSQMQQMPAAEVMFEYRHTPEPRYIREILQPALRRHALEYHKDNDLHEHS